MKFNELPIGSVFYFESAPQQRCIKGSEGYYHVIDMAVHHVSSKELPVVHLPMQYK